MLEWQKRDAEKVLDTKSIEDKAKMERDAIEAMKPGDAKSRPKIKSKKKSHWAEPDL